MFPHPHTVVVLKQMEHRERLAGAGPTMTAAMRSGALCAIGAAFIAVGTRLQGADPAATAAPTAS
jgi:hypothetical protein